jgi:hypothetical protein
LDEIINNTDNQLSADEIENLITIRHHIEVAANHQQLMEWITTLFNFLVAYHELFKK